jgi:hypothetical protein
MTPQQEKALKARINKFMDKWSSPWGLYQNAVKFRAKIMRGEPIVLVEDSAGKPLDRIDLPDYDFAAMFATKLNQFQKEEFGHNLNGIGRSRQRDRSVPVARQRDRRMPVARQTSRMRPVMQPKFDLPAVVPADAVMPKQTTAITRKPVNRKTTAAKKSTGRKKKNLFKRKYAIYARPIKRR